MLIFNFILFTATFLLLYFSFRSGVMVYGGTFGYIYTVFWTQFLYFFYKNFRKELLYLSILFFSISLLNFTFFFSFFNIAEWLTWAFLGLIALAGMFFSITKIFFAPLYSPSPYEVVLMEARKKILFGVVFFVLQGMVFCVATVEMFFLCEKNDLMIGGQPALPSLFIILLPSSFFLSFFLFRKAKDVVIRRLLRKEFRINFSILKKHMIGLGLFVIFSSFIFELQRGYWILWAGNIVFLIGVFLLLSKTWLNVSCPESENQFLVALKSIPNPEENLRLILVTTIIFVFLGTGLALLLIFL